MSIMFVRRIVCNCNKKTAHGPVRVYSVIQSFFFFFFSSSPSLFLPRPSSAGLLDFTESTVYIIQMYIVYTYLNNISPTVSSWRGSAAGYTCCRSKKKNNNNNNDYDNNNKEQKTHVSLDSRRIMYV